MPRMCCSASCGYIYKSVLKQQRVTRGVRLASGWEKTGFQCLWAVSQGGLKARNRMAEEKRSEKGMLGSGGTRDRECMPVVPASLRVLPTFAPLLLSPRLSYNPPPCLRPTSQRRRFSAVMAAYPRMDPYMRSRYDQGIDAKIVVMGNTGQHGPLA
jgi:hypothetical protein